MSVSGWNLSEIINKTVCSLQKSWKSQCCQSISPNTPFYATSCVKHPQSSQLTKISAHTDHKIHKKHAPATSMRQAAELAAPCTYLQIIERRCRLPLAGRACGERSRTMDGDSRGRGTCTAKAAWRGKCQSRPP